MAEKIIPVPSRRIKDRTGEKHGRLTVLGYVGQGYMGARFLCQCQCGREKIANGADLYRGSCQSCGCLQKERTKEALVERNTTHGLSLSPEYKIWDAMRRRCAAELDAGYENYGGRGIRVCDRWESSFDAFYDDMGPRPSPKHSIERRDNSGNYEPGNCYWATRHTQCRNRRSNIYVMYRGERMILKDAAILAGVLPATAYVRMRKGWSLDRVLAPV